MAEKTVTNPKGAGRPKVDEHLRKVPLPVRVPKWIKDTINEGGLNASELVSTLLEEHFKEYVK